jgi:hypothetical protein
MIRSKYVLPEFTGNVKPPANNVKMVKINP